MKYVKATRSERYRTLTVFKLEIDIKPPADWTGHDSDPTYQIATALPLREALGCGRLENLEWSVSDARADAMYTLLLCWEADSPVATWERPAHVKRLVAPYIETCLAALFAVRGSRVWRVE